MGRIVTASRQNISNQILEHRWTDFKPVSEYFEGDIHCIRLIPYKTEIRCPHCGRGCLRRHARQDRVLWDMPLIAYGRLKLICEIHRYRCDGCHRTFAQQPLFAEARSRLTHALVYYAQSLMRVVSCSLRDVQQLTGLSGPTLKRLDKEQLKYCYEDINLTGVRNLAIDEFSVHKGHKYATVVLDNDTCRVLWLGKGKSRSSVQPFFDLLKNRGMAENIQSVACDQNAAYPSLVENNLPKAVVVYDLFHVMKHWRDDVLLPAKKRAQNDAVENAVKALTKGETPSDSKALAAARNAARKSMSGADWVLITPLESIPENKRAQRKQMLDRMTQDNALLAALYPLAESLRGLWKTKSRQDAAKKIQQLRLVLLEIARTHSFPPARRFASMLRRRYTGIIDAGRFGFTTNRLEGVNNKIKVIKRIAYGFQDLDYFFLKIKSALPGKYAIPLFNKLSGYAVTKDRLVDLQKGCCTPSNA